MDKGSNNANINTHPEENEEKRNETEKNEKLSQATVVCKEQPLIKVSERTENGGNKIKGSKLPGGYSLSYQRLGPLPQSPIAKSTKALEDVKGERSSSTKDERQDCLCPESLPHELLSNGNRGESFDRDGNRTKPPSLEYHRGPAPMVPFPPGYYHPYYPPPPYPHPPLPPHPMMHHHYYPPPSYPPPIYYRPYSMATTDANAHFHLSGNGNNGPYNVAQLPPAISQNNINKKPNRAKYCRKEKSLGLICENFITRCRKYGGDGKHDSDDDRNTSSSTNHEDAKCLILIDVTAKDLNVEARRIYDIVNILESIDIVSRRKKKTYLWCGTSHLPYIFIQLQQNALALWPKDAEENGITSLKSHDVNTSMENTDLNIISPNSMNSNSRAIIKDHPHRPNLGGFVESKNSLGRLTQLFLQIFLVGNKIVSLPYAVNKITAFYTPASTPTSETLRIQNHHDKESQSDSLSFSMSPSEKENLNITHSSSSLVSTSTPSLTINDEENSVGSKRSIASSTISLMDNTSSIPAKEKSNKIKTKLRRLYDIANVMSSLGIISKVPHLNTNNGAGNAQSFQWTYSISPADLKHHLNSSNFSSHANNVKEGTNSSAVTVESHEEPIHIMQNVKKAKLS